MADRVSNGLTPFRVIVTGSRDWPDPARIRGALEALACQHPEGLTVVHGDCPDGADRMSRDWAREQRRAGRRVADEPHPADWLKYGRAAGFRRNAEMAALGADMCIAYLMPCVKPACRDRAPHDSHGTADCVGHAVRAGIDTRRFWLDGPGPASRTLPLVF